MRIDGNHGNLPNYEPNSFKTFSFAQDARYAPYRVTGLVARHKPNHPNCDFIQAGDLYRKVMDEGHRQRLVKNLANHIKGAMRSIQ
jgi:catalase